MAVELRSIKQTIENTIETTERWFFSFLIILQLFFFNEICSNISATSIDVGFSLPEMVWKLCKQVAYSSNNNRFITCGNVFSSYFTTSTMERRLIQEFHSNASFSKLQIHYSLCEVFTTLFKTFNGAHIQFGVSNSLQNLAHFAIINFTCSQKFVCRLNSRKYFVTFFIHDKIFLWSLKF